MSDGLTEFARHWWKGPLCPDMMADLADALESYDYDPKTRVHRIVSMALDYARGERYAEVKPTDWENYRQLREGEIILAGDEHYDDRLKGWVRSFQCVGTPAPDPCYTAHRKYRRPTND